MFSWFFLKSLFLKPTLSIIQRTLKVSLTIKLTVFGFQVNFTIILKKNLKNRRRKQSRKPNNQELSKAYPRKSQYILEKFMKNYTNTWDSNTTWKVSVFGVFLVHILLHSDWIRRDTEYSVQMRQNKDQKTPIMDTFHAV